MKASIQHIIFLFVALGFAHAPAAPIQKWFEAANSAYQSQEYDTAVAYYEKIIGAGMCNSDVYFNLGNAYYRRDKLGLAILYYEKARRLAPTDRDIEANIHFANKYIVDKVPEPQRSFFDSLLWRLHTFFSLEAQLWIFWGLLVALSIFFSAGLFVSRNVRLWLIYLGSLCLLAMVSMGISAGVKIYAVEKTKEAIVLEKSVDALNEPEGGKVLFTAHEGTKFRILKREGSWCLVSLPNGVKGWVESGFMGEI